VLDPVAAFLIASAAVSGLIVLAAIVRYATRPTVPSYGIVDPAEWSEADLDRLLVAIRDGDPALDDDQDTQTPPPRLTTTRRGGGPYNAPPI